MKVMILGKREVNFVAEDGRQIAGASLYIGYEKDGVDGMVAEKVFVSAAKLPMKPIVVGADAEIYFDSRGKVDSVVVS